MYPKKIKAQKPRLDLELLILLSRTSGIQENIKYLADDYINKEHSDEKLDKDNLDRLEWKLRHILGIIDEIRKIR